jgi:S1-C subfamily serine protease
MWVLITSLPNMLEQSHEVHAHQQMSTRRLRIVTSGMIATAAAIGATTIDVIAPVNLLNLSLKVNSAFAQDVDEQINIRVYQRASPAVVSIDTGNGTGSGSIISPDGLVLTNAHVVEGSRTVDVILADGRKFRANVVGFGGNGLDLAVVKIQGQKITCPPLLLPEVLYKLVSGHLQLVIPSVNFREPSPPGL